MEKSLQEGEIRLWETARLKTSFSTPSQVEAIKSQIDEKDEMESAAVTANKQKLDANSQRTVQASWEQENKQ